MSSEDSIEIDLSDGSAKGESVGPWQKMGDMVPKGEPGLRTWTDEHGSYCGEITLPIVEGSWIHHLTTCPDCARMEERHTMRVLESGELESTVEFRAPDDTARRAFVEHGGYELYVAAYRNEAKP